jgi:hypothetical protein
VNVEPEPGPGALGIWLSQLTLVDHGGPVGVSAINDDRVDSLMRSRFAVVPWRIRNTRAWLFWENGLLSSEFLNLDGSLSTQQVRRALGRDLGETVLHPGRAAWTRAEDDPPLYSVLFCHRGVVGLVLLSNNRSSPVRAATKVDRRQAM